jgi:glycosyltransferase involved in cell wall biosynthesis
LIPALNEAENLQSLLPDVDRVLRDMPVDFEVVVVGGGSGDATRLLVENAGARFVNQTGRGYGQALSEGFQAANGAYVLTMDADHSHEPSYIRTLWDHRGESKLVIASRYVAHGSADTAVFRSVLSRLLNGFYRRFLGMPFRDLSSGFRIYPRAGLRKIDPKGRDFDVLPEVLVLLYSAGHTILEVPFHYRPRRRGRSRVKLFRCGWSYLKTLLRMRRLRNSEPIANPPREASEASWRNARSVRRSVEIRARRS